MSEDFLEAKTKHYFETKGAKNLEYDGDLDGIIDSTLRGLIIGVEWDRSSSDPALTRIDVDGNTITTLPWSFDAHPVWSAIRRCTLSPEGYAAYGSNARGDGLTLDGSTGRVMVEVPKFYVKSEHPSADIYRWWISPSPYPGFELHPAFVQSHAAALKGFIKDFIHLGAYEADFEYDGDNEAYDAGHEKLHSRTGKQPMTGGQIWEVDFDNGNNEPAIGDEVYTVTEAAWFIVDYVKTGGAWGGTATGKIWVRKPGDVALGWLDNEQITKTVGDVDIAECEFTGGAKTAHDFDIGDARTLANNIGARWGIENVWSMSAVQLLYIVEYANFYSQSLTLGIGQGVVNKAAGVGFAGELTGADNADTTISTNGTGSGDGVDGVTPIVWRGMENIWGNVHAFIDGYNAVDGDVGATDVKYRLAKRDGLTVFADALATYEESSNFTNPVDGYVTDIEYEDLLGYLLIGSAVVGSSSTYLCDYLYVHDSGETNILLCGGSWFNGDWAGVAFLSAGSVSAVSDRHVGARLEYI